MTPYRPTYTYGISTNTTSRNFTCGYVPKATEANRGGLDKINTDLIRYNRFSSKDLINFALDNNDPVYECPPPEPTPTPTSPYSYSNSIVIDIVP